MYLAGHATGYAHTQRHSPVKFGVKLNVRGLIRRRKPTTDCARHRQGGVRSSQATEIYQFLLGDGDLQYGEGKTPG
jgi:hypothetical protein